MHLIDGNTLSREILAELADTISGRKGAPPCIAFVRVGEDPASVFYVRKKEKTAASIGMRSLLRILPESTTQDELLAVLDELNFDASVHGILVQSPLPAHLDEIAAFNRVAPEKDVDGLSEISMGRLVQERTESFAPCTPSGIVELLQRSGIPVEGRHVVVLGRSLLVGKSAALLFMRKAAGANATVTLCHSRTKDLPSLTRQADILIAGIGRPHYVTREMVKEGAVVIDVGINRIQDPTDPRGYRIVGDVDFDAVAPITFAITPVPGGVGPMTVAMLMKNTLKACQQAHQRTSPL